MPDWIQAMASEKTGVGDPVGTAVGAIDGFAVGIAEGAMVGTDDGVAVGFDEGAAEGAADGVADGTADGSLDGDTDGADEGTGVGESVNVFDGAWVGEAVASLQVSVDAPLLSTVVKFPMPQPCTARVRGCAACDAQLVGSPTNTR